MTTPLRKCPFAPMRTLPRFQMIVVPSGIFVLRDIVSTPRTKIAFNL
jgi:hypothetical protein